LREGLHLLSRSIDRPPKLLNQLASQFLNLLTRLH
jgi:hypothetical protein